MVELDRICVTNSSSMHSTYYQDSDTDDGGNLDAESMGYSLYGGYQFNRIVGIELGYTDYADYESSGIKVFSPKSLPVAANLGYTFDKSIRPFVLAGISYVNLNANSSGNLKMILAQFSASVLVWNIRQ